MSFGQYFNLKKYIVFIPSALFIFFGIETFASLYTEIFHSVGGIKEEFSLIPLLVSLTGIFTKHLCRDLRYL